MAIKNNRKKNETDAGPINALLPGVHGKGLYSGQGCMYFTNNGEGTQEALKKFDVEAGVLAEWDGKEWKVVRRNQFVEVTGPGGILEMRIRKQIRFGQPVGIINRLF